MGAIYIRKLTKARYPNILREANKGRRKPLSSIYSMTYAGSTRGSMKALGWAPTLKEAKTHATQWGRRRLGTKSPTIKVER